MVLISYAYSIPFVVALFGFFLCSIPITNNIEFNKKNHFDFYQIIFCGAIFIFFFCFRGYVWTDWKNYAREFNLASSLFYKTNHKLLWEPGFCFTVYLLKSICPNYFFLQFVYSFIDFFILYWFFKRYIPNHIVLGFVFYFVFSGTCLEINLLRNSKSIMLFLISLKYVNEKKILKYILLNLIGVCFHISSVIYLPLYFILNKKYNKFFVLILFIFGNIVFLAEIHWAKNFLRLIAPICGKRISFHINAYLDSKLFSAAYGVTIGYLERTFTFFIIYYFFVFKNNKNEYLQPFVNIFLIYTFVYLYFSEMFVLLQRIPFLFSCGHWILFPVLYEKRNKDFKVFILLFLLFYGGLKQVSGNKAFYARYTNILTSNHSYEEMLSGLHWADSKKNIKE